LGPTFSRLLDNLGHDRARNRGRIILTPLATSNNKCRVLRPVALSRVGGGYAQAGRRSQRENPLRDRRYVISALRTCFKRLTDRSHNPKRVSLSVRRSFWRRTSRSGVKERAGNVSPTAARLTGLGDQGRKSLRTLVILRTEGVCLFVRATDNPAVAQFATVGLKWRGQDLNPHRILREKQAVCRMTTQNPTHFQPIRPF
jgi:hypothetical protein